MSSIFRIRCLFGVVAVMGIVLSACDPAPANEPNPPPAVSLPSAQPTPTSPTATEAGSESVTQAVGAIESLDCKTWVSSDPSTLTRPNVSCGLLSVPELHGDLTGKTIKVGFVQFKSGAATSVVKDAVVFLGDPAFSSIGWVSAWDYDLIASVLKERDLVVLEFRGTGHSAPALKCNGEMDEVLAEVAKKALSSEDWAKLSRDQAERCKTSWQTAGVNLSAYNSNEITQDVDDLRRALGYDKLNVWGNGYGTKLALLLMKLRPDIVRSAILDSPVPPQANLYTTLALAYERPLNKIFEACQADEKCNKAYPDFKQVFFELVDKLNGKPMLATVTKPKGGFVDYRANGNDLINAALQYLSFGQFGIENLAAEVYASAFLGQKSLLELTLRNSVWTLDNRATAAGLAVFCMDEGANVSSEEVMVTYSDAMRAYGDVFGVAVRADVCKAWGLPHLKDNAEIVTSDIPTLIVSGDWDPNTPLEWSEQAAQRLKNSYRFNFPVYSGNVLFTYADKCATVMLKQFLSNPSQSPENTCLRALPHFDFAIKTIKRK